MIFGSMISLENSNYHCGFMILPRTHTQQFSEVCREITTLLKPSLLESTTPGSQWVGRGGPTLSRAISSQQTSTNKEFVHLKTMLNVIFFLIQSFHKSGEENKNTIPILELSKLRSRKSRYPALNVWQSGLKPGLTPSFSDGSTHMCFIKPLS